MSDFPDFRRSANLAVNPALYEVENRAFDPEGLVLAAMQDLAPWAERGAVRREVMAEWRFTSRADLAAVLHLEFPAEVADPWLTAHPDVTALSYGYVLFAIGKD